MKKWRRWTNEDKDLLAKMKIQGMSNREIAVSMGRTIESTKQQVTRLGLKKKSYNFNKPNTAGQRGGVVKFVPGMTVAKARPKRVGPDVLQIEPIRPCGFDGCETSTKGRYCTAHALAMHRAVPHTKVRGEDMVPEVSRY